MYMLLFAYILSVSASTFILTCFTLLCPVRMSRIGSPDVGQS